MVSPPAVRPLASMRPVGVARWLGKIALELDARADPERQPRDQRVAPFGTLAEDHAHALREGEPEDDHDVGAQHRRRYGEDQGGDLRHEGERDEDGADVDADPAGGDADPFRERDAGRVGPRRGNPRESRQQRPGPAGGDGSLHPAEVDGPASAARNALHAHCVAHLADGDHEGDEEEAGKQHPEARVEVEVQAGRGNRGNAQPGTRRRRDRSRGLRRMRRSRIPPPIPMIGVQARSLRGARSMSATTASIVTAAIAGAAAGEALSGTRVSMAKPIGITVTETSASRVPETSGVMMRRSSARRAANANWQSADATTSVPSSAGPPVTRASTATPMEAPDIPITIRLPAPNGPILFACTMVRSPPITMPAKIAHDRYSGLWSAHPRHDGRDDDDRKGDQDGDLESHHQGERVGVEVLRPRSAVSGCVVPVRVSSVAFRGGCAPRIGGPT